MHETSGGTFSCIAVCISAFRLPEVEKVPHGETPWKREQELRLSDSAKERGHQSRRAAYMIRANGASTQRCRAGTWMEKVMGMAGSADAR